MEATQLPPAGERLALDLLPGQRSVEERGREERPSAENEELRKPPKAMRLASLDAFRGFTILGMLLVNNVALDTATPRHLTHAQWERGVHFADLVFPWFLLIVGVAITVAAAGARKRGMSAGAYRWKALGRAFSLVLIGCFLDSSLARRPLFGFGVLQLIGLAYLAGALLYELPFRWRMATAAGLLLLHWAALRFVPVPGIGVGAFTESDNLVAYLNRVYLQPLSLKGLISVVPTAALVLIGTAVGDALRREGTPRGRTALLLATGWALGLTGWLWSLDLPFSKPLWTGPYILFAAGWGTVLLALLYGVIDVWGWRAWAFPLVVFGANAIAAYVLPILVKTYILQGWHWTVPGGASLSLQDALLQLCTEHAGRVAGGWLYTFGYILFWWVVLWQMYRKQIFLRV